MDRVQDKVLSALQEWHYRRAAGESLNSMQEQMPLLLEQNFDAIDRALLMAIAANRSVRFEVADELGIDPAEAMTRCDCALLSMAPLIGLR